ncbi:alginate export family protein [Acetobacter fallax]|uniref:Alginate export domain-containing protein n=1 Tax=Acetobacter fallax TaxID=1737473 RepID=A0ABX0K6D3_9PROT|nr:alginate export family protein [Acetobacter fallax]NHO31460.1 hypothetical protein [Acetobacter fallax]NHO34956.1 hypothetical protein [Acetobacter fallax]
MNRSSAFPVAGTRYRSRVTVRLVSSTVLGSLALAMTGPASAETAPNAQINSHTQIPDIHRNQAHTVAQPQAGQTPVTQTPALTQKQKFTGTSLLPPLESRPENYAIPQALELPPQPAALLHQGPWGIFNSNTGAASGFGTVGYYAVSRWAEDWSNLRDKKNRIDFLDPLKYIPLNESGSIYLTLSGNFRHHGFYDEKPIMGTASKSPSYRSNLRWNTGADLHLGQHVRLYGELMSGQAGGINYYGYNNGRWRNKLDAQQAFVEVRGHLLGATMGAMVGRMTFLDAPPYITAGSVYPTIPYSWNGIRTYSFWKNFRVDLFDLTLTNWDIHNVPFHNQVGYRTRWFGAYTSYAIPSFKFMGVKSQVFVDTFYYGYLLASAPIAGVKGTIAGSTHRDTPGIRVWGNTGPIEFSLGAMWQGGSFNAANNGPSRSVSAYSFNAQISYRLAKLWGRPAIGLQADDISGGNYNKSQTSSWGGFLTPFVPSAYYLDMSTYFGNQNVIDVGPIATLAPTKNTTLLLKVPVMWRNSVNDAIYQNPLAAYAFRPHGGYVGTIPQASFTWRATRHITLSIDGEYIFASKALIQTGAQSGAYVQSNLELTF